MKTYTKPEMKFFFVEPQKMMVTSFDADGEYVDGDHANDIDFDFNEDEE